MFKEALHYLAMVKAAEAGPRLGGLEKKAMWNGFYDELVTISESGALRSLAYSKTKQSGVVSETLGGAAGALLAEHAINKIHPDISHGPHLALLTAGALAGSILANKLTRSKTPPEGTPGSVAYTNGREDSTGMGLVAASMYLQRHQSGLAKVAAYEAITQPATHAGLGALLGAGIGAVRAEKGKRLKGAKKGAMYGAAGGFAAGHVYKRALRGAKAFDMAAQEFGFPDSRAAWKSSKGQKGDMVSRAKDHAATLPIYAAKTAAAKKKEDPYESVGDSTWDKHKGKIIAGLALATAAGVGAKLLHNRHKFGKTHSAPPSPKPAAPKAPPPRRHPPAATKPPPSQPQGHVVAGREVPAWATPKPAKRPNVADVQAKMDPRKQRRRERFKNQRRRPLTDEEHDAMEGYER
jgi:hypothetical protein